MALFISVPDSANTRQTIPLDGQDYVFDITFNSRNRVWHIDIYLARNPIILGLAVREDVVLNAKYDLPAFNNNFLVPIRVRNDDEEPDRDNFGLGKSYELVHYLRDEVIDILNDNSV